jgi:hypothetical protein
MHPESTVKSFADITGPNDHHRHGNHEWEQRGVLHLPGLIPDELIDGYVEERRRLLGGTPKWRPGWNDPVPYLRVESMRRLALYRPLTEAIRGLIGSEPGLHLCLTGFESTERAWHQDRYLNPEGVGERYIAAWIALDDVSPDAGPFEYAPGSHLWPVIEREKVWAAMRDMDQDPTRPTWPSDSQHWVGAACEAEIEARGATVEKFLGKRGDVLLWHASLIHRGSKPLDRQVERRALISHYSSIHARPDMPHLRRIENGSFYFEFAHGYAEPAESTHRSM